MRKTGEKEIKTQKASKGEGPTTSRAKPRQVSPGQESPVPEEQELHRPSRAERGSRGVGAGPQEGGDALRLPETVTDTCAPGESPAPRARSSSEGLGRRLRGGGCGAGARIHQRRLRSTGRRDTAQDPAYPRERERPGGPRTARTLLPRAEQISGPAPEPPGPADRELRGYCGS